MQAIPAQLPIIDAVKLGKTISVDAVPGGGKSTILKMIDDILQSKTFTALMFSNALATELKADFNFGEVSTLHAYGLKACREYCRIKNIKAQVKTENGKTFRTLVHEETTENAIFQHVKQTYGLAKAVPQRLIIQNESTPFNLVIQSIKKAIESIVLNAIDYHSHDLIHKRFDIVYGNEYVAMAIEVLTKIVESHFLQRGQLDFLGMLYIPVINTDVQRYITTPEIVAIDESQDSNPLMQEMYKLIAKHAKQVIMLGDSNQTIHIWNNTSPIALRKLSEHFQAESITYSVSFRLPHTVTNYLNASGLDRLITAWTDKQGAIESISLSKAMMKELRNGDWVLGRFNKVRSKDVMSLEKLSIELLKLGKNVRLLGSDYIEICRRCWFKIDEKSNTKILDLDVIIKKEIAVIEQDKGKGHYKARKLADDLEVFILYYNFFQGKSTKLAFLPFLETMYASDENAITLCTYHRSKGKEAKRIFLMHVDLIYSEIVNVEIPLAQRIEAKNLLYVGITRTLDKLFVIDGQLPTFFPTLEYVEQA